VEADLAAIDGAFVEDLGRYRFWREIYPFLFRFVENGGEKAHLEFEGEHIDAGSAALAAFGNGFLHEQTAEREVDWSHHHETTAGFAMKE
jgi:hypothetical protein